MPVKFNFYRITNVNLFLKPQTKKMPKNSKISQVRALEILDSRGNPTLKVEIKTKDGTTGFATVPSGASTGSHEALEMRDKNKKRYFGKGVLNSIKIIEQKIFPAIKGLNVTDQQKIDRLMVEMDKTTNKKRLGANSILGVSLACARAGSIVQGVPLFRYLQSVYSFRKEKKLPVPMCNVINGGQHSDSGLDIQEFMVVPQGIKKSFSEKIRAVSEIYQTLGQILKSKGYSVAVGDEGGYAAHLKTNQAPLEFIEMAAKQAGYRWGEEIMLGIDSAASEFYQKEKQIYRFEKEKKNFTSQELVKLYVKWAKRFPLAIIEDGLAEDDWSGWQELQKKLGDKVALIGDDLTVTNTIRLQKAITREACNSVLIKPNQIGTLSETIECIRLAQAHKFKVAVSHRSGDTPGCFIADLAVATGADYLKSGAPCRGERVAKYNRLIEIERWY